MDTNDSELEVNGTITVNSSLVISGDNNEIITSEISTMELNSNIEIYGENNLVEIKGELDINADLSIINNGTLNLEGNIITNDSVITIKSSNDSSVTNIRHDYTIGDDIKLNFISGEINIDSNTTIGLKGDI
jgi:hypothetical protein